jgi:hydrogenase maturation factor HypF (carbamoyltransferase family)
LSRREQIVDGIVEEVGFSPFACGLATDLRLGGHAGLAALIAEACDRGRERTGLAQVVLTGGGFLNAVQKAPAIGRVTASATVRGGWV